ncbi:hypothetical protein KB553_11505 [Chryseobacterium rhizoplanae]|uniref:hypothetical protein n=1 Tax=Chryseobacterium rhizoplanae TaxID=1609531 RepID=UPI001CE2EFFE|nr:hypothetical protein [Chryseobacterium rhizoplanae]UCA62118.1 hypothetical protein KB553_11505 [Chryseobacterium rhizoplanae]
MSIELYYTFKDFEMGYLLDYEKLFKHLTLNEYYKALLEEYASKASIVQDSFDINDTLVKYNNSIVDAWVAKKKQAINADKLYKLQNAFDWAEICDKYFFEAYWKYISSSNKRNKAFTNEEIFRDFCVKNLSSIQESLWQNLMKINYFLQRKIIESNATLIEKKQIKRLTNPKKLALLQVMGFFDLPAIANLSSDKQNEIVALLLDADKKEFVYKNRLNLNSKNPNYQIDKYTAYQYLEEMKAMLNNME